jgi:hypothetical protein
MTDKKVSEVLKGFGLPDDTILEIALSGTLKEGVSILKNAMSGKWDMDTITAMKTVEKLKTELK